MDENQDKSCRCWPLPQPLPRWLAWVIAAAAIGLVAAVALPLAIKAAREDARRGQPAPQPRTQHFVPDVDGGTVID